MLKDFLTPADTLGKAVLDHEIVTYSCDKHGDWTSKVIVTGYDRLPLHPFCPTCKISERAKQEQLRQLKEHAEIYNNIMAKLNIPPKYSKFRLDTYPGNSQAQREALKVAEQYVNNLDSIRAGKGLSLFGPPGVGKTGISFGIAEGIAAKYRIQSCYVKQYKILDIYQEDKTSYNHLLSVDMLIIDEVGVNNNTWQQSKTYEVIDQRMDYAKPTILLSNLPVKDYFSNIPLALQSRLRERNYPVNIIGKDLREDNGVKISGAWDKIINDN